MKNFKLLVSGCVACAAMSWFSSTAMAQGGGPSNLQYTPRPTVSPYLNLFVNPGAVGNYQNNVRPFLEQYDINSRQSSNINQLQQELNQVRTSTGIGATGASGRIRPTGHAAVFMDGSHYFNGKLK